MFSDFFVKTFELYDSGNTDLCTDCGLLDGRWRESVPCAYPTAFLTSLSMMSSFLLGSREARAAEEYILLVS